MTRKLLSAAIIAATLPAGFAQAQVTGTVVGTSTDPVYSQAVQTSAGVTYYCRPGVVQRNGQNVRICRRVGGGNNLMSSNAGAAAAAVGAVALIAVVASNDT